MEKNSITTNVILMSLCVYDNNFVSVNLKSATVLPQRTNSHLSSRALKLFPQYLHPSQP